MNSIAALTILMVLSIAPKATNAFQPVLQQENYNYQRPQQPQIPQPYLQQQAYRQIPQGYRQPPVQPELYPQAYQEYPYPGDYSNGYGGSQKQQISEMWSGESTRGSIGVQSFARINSTTCLLYPDVDYDIGIIGVPFDTDTSYRSGTRFGPRAIRDASLRQPTSQSFDPYRNWASFMDCGDIPIRPMDNKVALDQMTSNFEELLLRRKSSKDPEHPPRYIALGGDHSIILPHLRALKKLYGKIAVIHFDAHLDTWSPSSYPSFWNSDQSIFTHGSMLWMARNEGLLSDDNNVHIGVRTRISGHGWHDFEDETKQGWKRYSSEEAWINGMEGLKKIVSEVRERVPQDMPTYISVDIDCLDAGNAPGTNSGLSEPGGLLPRELIYILRHLDLNLVGADIIEVSPQFDNAEVTATNAAQVVLELITTMVKKGKPLPISS